MQFDSEAAEMKAEVYFCVREKSLHVYLPLEFQYSLFSSEGASPEKKIPMECFQEIYSNSRG